MNDQDWAKGPAARPPAVVHGGLDQRELARLGLDAENILDFSVCTNPFGPSPRVYEALARVDVAKYPDRGAGALRDAVALLHQSGSEQILAGNGASELISLVATAFLSPGDRVLVIGPTYGEYARSALLQRGVVSTLNARASADFKPDLAEIEDALKPQPPRMIFLCNPNNPTGAGLPREWITSMAARHSRALFVVDEAYQNFAPAVDSLAGAPPGNVIVLRSMTKDYALAGLRLGYALAAPELIVAMSAVQTPWSVNALAQAAGVAALGDQEHLAQSLRQTDSSRRELIKDLEGEGVALRPSSAHYFLMGVGDGAALRRALLGRNILVRDAASFGLPEYVRVASRRPEENARLVEAIKACKSLAAAGLEPARPLRSRGF